MGTKYEPVALHIQSVVHAGESADDHGDAEGVDEKLLVHRKSAVVEITVDEKSSSDATTTRKTPTQQSGQIRFKFLSGLRGVAAMSVSLYHAGYFPGAEMGRSSVDVFFVLSAFLLTTLNESKFRKLMDRKASAREWEITLADYFVKRILRVYPLFALVVVILTCMPVDLRTHYYRLEHYHNTWSLFGVLTFAHGYRYAVFWTLPIEMGYYFIIPVFVAGVCALGRLKWAVIAALYCWVFYASAYVDRSDHTIFYPHVSPLVAGSLAATVYADVNRWMKKRQVELRSWQLALLRVFEWIMLTSVISDVCHGIFTLWFGGSLFPAYDKSWPFISVPASAVIVIEILAPSAISRCLEWNVFCYAGKISFSMYLLHLFVIDQPSISALPRYDRFIVRLALIFLVSSASYFFVERPMQRLAAAISKILARYVETS